jgi:hypothetical protein
MEAKKVDVHAVFRAYTACPADPKVLILDVRPNKDFKKKHACLAYNIRLSSNGKVLAVSAAAARRRPRPPSALSRLGGDPMPSHHPSLPRPSPHGRPVLLQDYSQNSYDLRWSQDCWWARAGAQRPRAPPLLLQLLLLMHAWRRSSCAGCCCRRPHPRRPAATRRWAKAVLVYGDKDLRRDHPVLAFLAQEGRCHSLQYLKDGCAT